jgi:hypothetical protein
MAGGSMTTTTPTLLVEELRLEWRRIKQSADAAIAQVDDAGFFATIDAESNSIALIVKHLGSNLRSRWTDFYTTDGEKPDRDRDGEFIVAADDTRERLLAQWEAGWQQLFDTFDTMTAVDLARTVVIRWEPQSAPRATLRALTHAAAHVGQIVLLAKHVAGPEWRTLSIPRGQSRAFNEKLRQRFTGA